jgi:hypothetical protein
MAHMSTNVRAWKSCLGRGDMFYVLCVQEERLAECQMGICEGCVWVDHANGEGGYCMIVMRELECSLFIYLVLKIMASRRLLRKKNQTGVL